MNRCLQGSQDSWKHALIDCVMARCVWSLSNEDIVEVMCDNLEMNAKNWVFSMHEFLT